MEVSKVSRCERSASQDWDQTAGHRAGPEALIARARQQQHQRQEEDRSFPSRAWARCLGALRRRSQGALHQVLLGASWSSSWSRTPR